MCATPLFQKPLLIEQSEELRLIATSADAPARWMLEDDKDALRRAGVHFLDITDHQDLGGKHIGAKRVSEFPKKMSQNKLVGTAIKELHKKYLEDNLR